MTIFSQSSSILPLWLWIAKFNFTYKLFIVASSSGFVLGHIRRKIYKKFPTKLVCEIFWLIPNIERSGSLKWDISEMTEFYSWLRIWHHLCVTNKRFVFFRKKSLGYTPEIVASHVIPTLHIIFLVVVGFGSLNNTGKSERDTSEKRRDRIVATLTLVWCFFLLLYLLLFTTVYY